MFTTNYYQEQKNDSRNENYKILINSYQSSDLTPGDEKAYLTHLNHYQMKKLFTRYAIIFICLSGLTLNAQVPNWQWANASEGDNLIQRCKADNNGNLIVGGSYLGNMTFGGQLVNTHANNFPFPLPFLAYDLFFAKVDQSGNLVWLVYPTGVDTNHYSQTTAMEVDPLGNTIAWMQFTPKTPNAAVVFGTDTIRTPSSMIKLDPVGNVLWHMDFNREENMSNMVADTAGNIFIAQAITDTSITYDTVTVTNPHSALGGGEAVIVKFNSSGRALWGLSFGGNYSDGIAGMCTDIAGNLYVNGVFTSDTLFFNTTSYLVNTAPSISGGGDYFYAKFDTNGNLIWAKSIPWASAGITDFNSTLLFTSNNSGELFFLGSQSDTAFQIGPYNFSDPGNFVAKMDMNGDPVWATYISEPVFNYSIQLDGSGNVYTAGSFVQDSVMIANTMFYNVGSIFTGDVWLVTLDSSGSLLGSYQNGGDDEEFAYIAVNSNGSMYMAFSSSSNTVTFGNTAFTNPSFPVRHAYIAYSNPFITGVSDHGTRENLNLYPNPASTEINIRLREEISGPVTVNIINTLGEIISTVTINNERSPSVDVSGLPPGMYILQIRNVDYVSSTKFIKH